jgi:hypothetical protein
MRFAQLSAEAHACLFAATTLLAAVPLGAYERVERQVYGSVTFSHSPDALLFFDVKQAAFFLFERSGR